MKPVPLILAALISLASFSDTFAGQFDGVVFRANDGDPDGPVVSTTSLTIHPENEKIWLTKMIVVKGATRPYTFFGEAAIPKTIQDGKQYDLEVKGVSFGATSLGKEEMKMKLRFKDGRVYLTDTNGKNYLTTAYKDKDFLDGSSIQEKVQRAYKHYVKEYNKLKGN